MVGIGVSARAHAVASQRAGSHHEIVHTVATLFQDWHDLREHRDAEGAVGHAIPAHHLTRGADTLAGLRNHREAFDEPANLA